MVLKIKRFTLRPSRSGIIRRSIKKPAWIYPLAGRSPNLDMKVDRDWTRVCITCDSERSSWWNNLAIQFVINLGSMKELNCVTVRLDNRYRIPVTPLFYADLSSHGSYEFLWHRQSIRTTT